MENKTERFVIYTTESWDYETAEFEAKDLFDFAREMNERFWWSMKEIVLIVDKVYIDPFFRNEYAKAFWNSVETQILLKKLLDFKLQ